MAKKKRPNYFNAFPQDAQRTPKPQTRVVFALKDGTIKAWTKATSTDRQIAYLTNRATDPVTITGADRSDIIQQFIDQQHYKPFVDNAQKPDTHKSFAENVHMTLVKYKFPEEIASLINHDKYMRTINRGYQTHVKSHKYAIPDA